MDSGSVFRNRDTDRIGDKEGSSNEKALLHDDPAGSTAAVTMDYDSKNEMNPSSSSTFSSLSDNDQQSPLISAPSTSKQQKLIGDLDSRGKSYTILGTSLTTTFPTSRPENFMTQILSPENILSNLMGQSSALSSGFGSVGSSSFPRYSFDMGSLISNSHSPASSSSGLIASSPPISQANFPIAAPTPLIRPVNTIPRQQQQQHGRRQNTTPVLPQPQQSLTTTQKPRTPLVDEMRRGYQKFLRLRMMADQLDIADAKIFDQESLMEMLGKLPVTIHLFYVLWLIRLRLAAKTCKIYG
jgi:hypothetical protein